MSKLGDVEPDEVIVVGDTPYDAEAAAEVGLRTIGVLCGGFSEDSLRAAGCIVIYKGPTDLLAQYDRSLLLPLSPELITDVGKGTGNVGSTSRNRRGAQLRTIAMPRDTNAGGSIFGGWTLSRTDLPVARSPPSRRREGPQPLALKPCAFRSVSVGDEVSCDLFAGRGRSNLVTPLARPSTPAGPSRSLRGSGGEEHAATEQVEAGASPSQASRASSGVSARSRPPTRQAHLAL